MKRGNFYIGICSITISLLWIFEIGHSEPQYFFQSPMSILFWIAFFGLCFSIYAIQKTNRIHNKNESQFTYLLTISKLGFFCSIL